MQLLKLFWKPESVKLPISKTCRLCTRTWFILVCLCHDDNDDDNFHAFYLASVALSIVITSVRISGFPLLQRLWIKSEEAEVGLAMRLLCSRTVSLTYLICAFSRGGSATSQVGQVFTWPLLLSCIIRWCKIYSCN